MVGTEKCLLEHFLVCVAGFHLGCAATIGGPHGHLAVCRSTARRMWPDDGHGEMFA